MPLVADGQLKTFIAIGLVVIAVSGCASKGEDKAAAISRSLLDAAAAAETVGDHVAAANQYRSVLDRAPTNRDAVLGLARNLRYSGATQLAVETLDAAKGALLDDAGYRLELGKAKLALGDATAAISHLRAALEAGGDNWQAHAAIGIANDLLQSYGEARIAYKKALSLSVNNPAVLNNLAISLAISGDLDSAIETLENAPAEVRRDPQIRQNLALFYGIRGDTDKARGLARMDLDEASVIKNMAIYSRLGANRGTAIRR